MSTKKIAFEVVGLHKYAQRDNFENGCHGLSQLSWVDQRFAAETIENLVADICSFLDAKPDAVQLDACDEPGRIDIQVLENADGIAPSSSQLKDWKMGANDLSAVTYTANVSLVTRETVALVDASKVPA